MRTLLIIFFLTLQSLFGIAQNVIQQKLITKEGLFSFEGKIIKDSTEGYWIVGNMAELGVRQEFLIIRLNEDLSINWSKTHRGYFSGSFVDLVQLRDKNYLAVGYLSADKLYLSKFNSQGDTIWTLKYSNASPNSSKIINLDDQILIATSSGAILISSSGEIIWAKSYLWSSAEFVQCSDTTALLAGNRLFKIDTRNGDLLWCKRYIDSVSTLFRYNICASNEGNFILRGNGENPYIFKIDEDGNPLWGKAFKYSDDASFGPIIPTSDNNYMVAGNYGKVNNFLRKVLTLKFNEHGDTLYTAAYGGEKNNYNASLLEKDNGSLINLHTTNSFTSNYSFYINEFSADGRMQCNQLDIYPLSIEDVDISYEESYFISDVNLVLEHMEMKIFDVDLKDSVLCSNVISVPEIVPSENTVKIYPNPSSGNFKIEMGTSGFYEVEVFNFLGEKVFSTAASSSVFNVNLHNQPKGIYLVKVQSSGRSSFYKVQRQ
jgi:hypothetical protein